MEHHARVAAALALIAATPGYADVAAELRSLHGRGRIRFCATLPDRAHAGLSGAITLGPEALGGGAVSLAQTLVHEHHHLWRQGHLAKTASFWLGLATRTHVMARFERPAYQAALDFLATVAAAFPERAGEAAAERAAVAANFAACYDDHDHP